MNPGEVPICFTLNQSWQIIESKILHTKIGKIWIVVKYEKDMIGTEIKRH